MKKQTPISPQVQPDAGVDEVATAEPPELADAANDLVTKLQAENAELKAAARINAARMQITDELRLAGARSPGLLFDAVKGDLQFADDDKPLNAAVIVEGLTRRFPEQFGSEAAHLSIDGGAGRTNPPAVTREALAKMTTAEIARLDWSAVKQALANG